eukprot:TRINITY_DN9070_c0_g1_i2.p1 TRINITY_DN9070_c0_g1~~TRINITY_DN9070_c0_g1_i2.p1  ORF type:complete len:634 (+),score=91.63 TRINITY_DN9070_c0_g1_i2:216-2117(+)
MYDIMYLSGEHAKAIKEFYYCLDTVVAVFVFVVLPFVFTFCSDYFNEWRSAASDRPSKAKRIGLSLLSTIPGILCITATAVIGGLVDFSPDASSGETQPWIDATHDNQTQTEKTFRLLSSSIGLVGIPFFVIYVGAGFALIPLLLLKPKPTREEVFLANERIEDEVSTITQRMRTIKTKYLKRLATPVDERDRLDYDQHEKYKTELEESKELLTSQSTENACSIASISRKLLGGVVLLVVLALLGSIASGRLYSIINSDCGWRCSFVTSTFPGWYNPVQNLLTESHEVVAIIFFCFLFSLMFVAALAALGRLGINLIFAKFSVSEKPVEAQAIHMECIALILICSTVATWIPTVIPEYVVFANRKFEGDRCSFGNFNTYDIYNTETQTESLKTPSVTTSLSETRTVSETLSLSLPLPTRTATGTTTLSLALPTRTPSPSSTFTPTATVSTSLSQTVIPDVSVTPTLTVTLTDTVGLLPTPTTTLTLTQTETLPLLPSRTATLTLSLLPEVSKTKTLSITETETPEVQNPLRVLMSTSLDHGHNTRNGSHVEERRCQMTEIGKAVYALRLTHPVFSFSDVAASFGLVLSFVGFLIYFMAKGSDTLPQLNSRRRGYTSVESVFQPSHDENEFEFV